MPDSLFGKDTFQNLFLNSVIAVHVIKDKHAKSVGTGFIVRYDGRNYLITAAHIAADKWDWIWMHKSDCKQKGLEQYQSQSGHVLLDYANDVAVIDVTGHADNIEDFQDLPAFEWDTGVKNPGTLVLAAGSSLGHFSGTMTVGVLSINNWAINASLNVDLGNSWIQHSASLYPGNSGGPLCVDSGGLKVIGVNTHSVKDSENINFALKASIAEQITRDLVSQLLIGLPKAFKTNFRMALNEHERKALDVEQYRPIIVDNRVCIGFLNDKEKIYFDSPKNLKKLISFMKKNKKISFIKPNDKTFTYKVPCVRRACHCSPCIRGGLTMPLHSQMIHPMHQKSFGSDARITHIDFEPIQSTYDFTRKVKDQESVVVSFKDGDAEYFGVMPTNLFFS